MRRPRARSRISCVAAAKAVKFFPAVPAGGLAALGAFAAVFPGLEFCPTGGISEASAPDYLKLPCVPCVGGSWLATSALLAKQDWNAIAELARRAAALGAPTVARRSAGRAAEALRCSRRATIISTRRGASFSSCFTAGSRSTTSRSRSPTRACRRCRRASTALLRQVTFHKEQDNEARLERLIGALAHDERGLIDFERFQQRVGTELAGIVFTAHPTFALSPDANEVALGAHACRLRERAAERRGAAARAARDGAPRGAAHARRRSRFVRDRDPQPAQSDAAHAARGDRHGRGALPARLPSPQAAVLHGRDLGRLRPRRPHRHRLEPELELPVSARARGPRGAVRRACATCASATRTTRLGWWSRSTRSRAASARSRSASRSASRRSAREAEDSIRLGQLNRLALEKRTLKQDAIGAIDGSPRGAARRGAQRRAVPRPARVPSGVGDDRARARAAAFPAELGAAPQRDPARHRAQRGAGPEPVAPPLSRRGHAAARRRDTRERALRHGRARADHREARVHARGAIPEALRRPRRRSGC